MSDTSMVKAAEMRGSGREDNSWLRVVFSIKGDCVSVELSSKIDWLLGSTKNERFILLSFAFSYKIFIIENTIFGFILDLVGFTKMLNDFQFEQCSTNCYYYDYYD